MNHIENKIAGEALAKLGIANLRPQQKAPMEAIFSNRDVIVLMPTSGGKSLLYQLPAVMDDEGKLTLVLSPLKALQLGQGTLQQGDSRGCAEQRSVAVRAPCGLG